MQLLKFFCGRVDEKERLEYNISKFNRGEKTMVKTIRKKVYDTETAQIVKKVVSGTWGDPAGYETTLYVTEDGSYFLYTNGGETSPYPVEDIASVSKVNAKKWLEEN